MKNFILALLTALAIIEITLDTTAICIQGKPITGIQADTLASRIDGFSIYINDHELCWKDYGTYVAKFPSLLTSYWIEDVGVVLRGSKLSNVLDHKFYQMRSLNKKIHQDILKP
jgi:hypothetical protein